MKKDELLKLADLVEQSEFPFNYWNCQTCFMGHYGRLYNLHDWEANTGTMCIDFKLTREQAGVLFLGNSMGYLPVIHSQNDRAAYCAQFRVLVEKLYAEECEVKANQFTAELANLGANGLANAGGDESASSPVQPAEVGIRDQAPRPELALY